MRIAAFGELGQQNQATTTTLGQNQADAHDFDLTITRDNRG